MEAGPATRTGRVLASRWWPAPLAAALAIVTFIHLGAGANAAAWACVQIVLVALTAIDVATRRLPNVITLPTAAAALVLRALFERSDLAEVAIAGAAAFAVFYALALALRGGIGMGDVKLAAMLGCLLGAKVVPALTAGIFFGGVWALGLIMVRRATLRSSIAYGPFLALGGALAILFTNPPPLV
jgi:leader peptidase (prepilin peptidase) / N-methyltransferase